MPADTLWHAAALPGPPCHGPSWLLHLCCCPHPTPNSLLRTLYHQQQRRCPQHQGHLSQHVSHSDSSAPLLSATHLIQQRRCPQNQRVRVLALLAIVAAQDDGGSIRSCHHAQRCRVQGAALSEDKLRGTWWEAVYGCEGRAHTKLRGPQRAGGQFQSAARNAAARRVSSYYEYPPACRSGTAPV